jgi:hypothetical protein
LLNHILMSSRLSFNNVKIDLWLILPLINSYSHLYFHCCMNLFCKTSQLRTLIISSRNGSSRVWWQMHWFQAPCPGERFHLCLSSPLSTRQVL